MNSEQKKFKKVIKQRRKHAGKKKFEEARKVFAKLSPDKKAEKLFYARHKKDDENKKREEIKKELNIK